MPQSSALLEANAPKLSLTQRTNRLSLIRQRLVSSLALSLLLASHPTIVLAGPGHSHGGGEAFSGGSGSAKPIELDAQAAAEVGIKVEPVTQRQLAFGIPTTGQIEATPDRKVAVTTPVTGTISQLMVKPGDNVTGGQAVAILYSPELVNLGVEAKTKRAEAEADVRKAQAALRRAQQNYEQQNKIAAADIQQARTNLSFAQERYDKDKVLLERGAIPRRQLLDSETKLSESKASLAKAESRLEVSNALAELKSAQSDVQVAQSRIGLSDTAYRTRLAQLGSSSNPDGTVTIRAPISGTVADREATQGESAADPGKPLMTIVNDSSVLATANVFEKDLDQIRVGQPVRVTVKSLPNRTFNGRVTVVGSMIQGQTRALPVKAELDNPDGALKPGMFAKMDVITDRTYAAALAVPKSAIVDANGKTLVFIQEAGGHQEEEHNHQEGEKENEPGHQEGESHSEEKGAAGQVYEPVEVTLGRTAGDLVEIKNGVKAGDRVVTQGTTLLYAQSLQGGKAKEGDEHASEGGSEKAAATSQSGMLPWWLMLPLAGAIAVSTFWLGRRSKPPVILRDPGFADPDYKKDSDYKSGSN